MSTTEEQAAAQSSTVDDAPIITTVDIGTLEQKKAFLAAFAAAQGSFEPIVKNRNVKIVGKNKNGDRVEYQFRYADMQEIDARTRPALSSNGLSTSSPMLAEGKEGAWLSMILSHAEGFERRSEVFVRYGDEPKQFGALCSYMRRYMKTGLLDVTADDDLDENGQEGDDERTPAPPPAKRTPARKSDQAAMQATGASITHGKAADAAAAGLGEPDDGRFAPVETLAGDPAKPSAQEVERAAQDRAARAAETQQRLIDEKRKATPPPPPPPAIDPADNPATGAPPPAAAGKPSSTVDKSDAKADPSGTGELAQKGEIAYLLKRAKARGADMGAILTDLKLSHLDKNTLDGLFKAHFKMILDKV